MLFETNTKERIYYPFKNIDKKLKLKQSLICDSSSFDPFQPLNNTIFPKDLFKNVGKKSTNRSKSTLQFNKVAIKIPQLIKITNTSMTNHNHCHYKTNTSHNGSEPMIKPSRSAVKLTDITEKQSRSCLLNSSHKADNKNNGLRTIQKEDRVYSSKLLQANLPRRQSSMLVTSLLKTPIRRSSIIDRFILKVLKSSDAVIEDYYHESRPADHYAKFKMQLMKTKRKLAKLIDNVQKAASMNESMMNVHIHNISKCNRSVSLNSTVHNFEK